jgi:SAM-dependent methyltransferase
MPARGNSSFGPAAIEPGRKAVTLASVDDNVTSFYEEKTQAVLRRFGPGPRIHYRTGFIDGPVKATTIAELCCELVAGQERVLYHASDFWDLRRVAFRDVLDAGCGLGGGAIFWAQEFGANVIAATIAPSHVELVRKFAKQAGVAARVQPLLCDALAVPGENCFDAALAMDSSDTFPRRPWFRRLATLLRPHGHVFIYDCFLENAEYAGPINRHWCAMIGTFDEYTNAAREAGFRLERFQDVSHRAREFWTLTIALYEAERRAGILTPWDHARFQEAVEVHALMRRGLYDGGLRYALVSFVKD